MNRSYRFLLALLFVTVPAPIRAETIGKIAGHVFDQATGDPLPGVNLQIPGTNLRSISGPRGEYFMVNVPIGTHDIEARMIGYLTVLSAGISVSADLTTRADFSLQTTVLDLNETLIITAPRPMIRQDMTASSEVLRAEDIRTLPVSSVSDIIALQSGTVRDAKGELHIRGGRSDEITYYVDGTEFRDPMLGGIGTVLNLDSIEEMVINRGGFDAQYGDAMSGIVNIMTKEGHAGYSGRFRNTISLQSQYDVRKGSYGSPGANGRNISGSLGGPLPLMGNSGSFFIAGQQLLTGNYLPHNSRQTQSINGNITLRPHPLLKVKIAGHVSESTQEIYDHRDDVSGMSYDFNLGGLPEKRDRSRGLNLSVNHSLTPQTYYTARLYRFTTRSKLAPTRIFDQYWDQWPGYSQDPGGRYTGQIYNDNLQIGERFGGLHFTDGNDFLPWFRQSKTTYNGARFDLSSQISYRNQLQFGMEGQWYKVAWDEKSFQQTTPSGEQYEANPVEGALYLQNKLLLARWILNGGIRMDYFDTGERFFVNTPTGQAELRNSPTKIRLSPRLGVSHPITSRSLFRLSYGYFFQAPEFRFVYENLRQDLDTELPRVGNPNLDPQKTVAYEMGIEQLLTDDIRLGLTASYKRLSNLTSTTQIQYPGGSYSLFTNADHGVVQSLELSLKRRFVRHFAGSIRYTLSSAEGSASDPQERYNRLLSAPDGNPLPVPGSVFPLAHDQRHSLKTVVSAYTPTTWQRRFLGMPLNDMGLTLIAQYGSGLPYTPTNSLNQQIGTVPNSARLPSSFNIDLRFRKRFAVGGTSYTFFTEIQNLLDRKNVISVYSNTGSPTDDGYSLESKLHNTPESESFRRLLSLDPQNFSSPREIRAGFELSF